MAIYYTSTDIPTQPINTSSSKEEEVIATESQSRLSADIPSSLNTRSSNIHNNKVEDKQDSNKRKRHGRHRSSTQQEQVCIREDDKKVGVKQITDFVRFLT